jgi:hypothetical protein
MLWEQQGLSLCFTRRYSRLDEEARIDAPGSPSLSVVDGCWEVSPLRYEMVA